MNKKNISMVAILLVVVSIGAFAASNNDLRGRNFVQLSSAGEVISDGTSEFALRTRAAVHNPDQRARANQIPVQAGQKLAMQTRQANFQGQGLQAVPTRQVPVQAGQKLAMQTRQANFQGQGLQAVPTRQVPVQGPQNKQVTNQGRPRSRR